MFCCRSHHCFTCLPKRKSRSQSHWRRKEFLYVVNFDEKHKSNLILQKNVVGGQSLKDINSPVTSSKNFECSRPRCPIYEGMVSELQTTELFFRWFETPLSIWGGTGFPRLCSFIAYQLCADELSTCITFVNKVPPRFY